MKTTPPHDNFDVSLVHALRDLYREVYISSGKMPKRDKLGIYSEIEKTILKTFSLTIEAVYKSKCEKKPILEDARISIEIIKQLVRLSHEMNSLDEKNYLRFASMLQEISRMTNGWIRYLNTQNPPNNWRT